MFSNKLNPNMIQRPSHRQVINKKQRSLSQTLENSGFSNLSVASSNNSDLENVNPNMYISEQQLYTNQQEEQRVQRKADEERKGNSPLKKSKDDSRLFPEERFQTFIEVKSPRDKGSNVYFKSTRIVENADHFQVGTMMYSKDQDLGEINKRFVPIFPFLYNDVGNGRSILGAEFYLPKSPQNPIPLPRTDKQTNEEVKDEGGYIPTKATVRFIVDNDTLHQFEESRQDPLINEYHNQVINETNELKRPQACYISELEFCNMKAVHLIVDKIESKGRHKSSAKSKQLDVKIYIQMHKPCPVQKIYNRREQKPLDVRSPFRHPTDQFLNYWNLHQVFYICGKSYQDSLQSFIQAVQARNPLCKLRVISQTVRHLFKSSLYYNTSEKIITDHMPRFQNENGNSQNVPILRDLIRRQKAFKSLLPKLRLPLMFSVLALLSQDKVNLFTESLILFMEYLIVMSGFNNSERQSHRGACIIDKMITSEILDFKKQPGINLILSFQKYKQNANFTEEEVNKQDDLNFMKQRRLMISPTIDYYQVQVEDETCLVLRKYKDNISRFIRVTFVNESFEKGFYQQHSDGGRSRMLGYIHSMIKYGIKIYSASQNQDQMNPGCVLRFLNYSNSQIKRHSSWFLVGPEQVDENDPLFLGEKQIIESLGEFSFEKNILKRYARRGQCFSTAKFVLTLRPEQIVANYPDIKRNGKCFTDGAGHISPRLAAYVSERFGNLPCSAFQIRIGGAKGVLMTTRSNDDLINEQTGRKYDIRLRESQIKFPSNDLSFNVVRCATYSQGYLNRQLIILLSCLGVPDQVFIDLQRKAKQHVQVQEIFKNLTIKTQNVYKAFRKNFTGKGNVNFLVGNGQPGSENQQSKELADLVNFRIGPSHWFQDQIKSAMLTGYELQKDPIMSSILYTMQLSQTLAIKKRARISLEDSCVLIGVVDDQGILKPNEIFVQIRKEKNTARANARKSFKSQVKNVAWWEELIEEEEMNLVEQQIIEGKLVVSRNPCTHPGDVRLLKGVNRPEFHHLFNVVVFPSTGDRPLCNMMSGGDLDGDVYFVCWNNLITDYLTEDQIQPPANYQKPDKINEKPFEESIADYFTFYLERDVLGQLANLHLALCDLKGRLGPLDPTCIELSGLQSVAVDFAKHGESVPKEKFQKIMRELKNEWPDFFEKTRKEIRESTGVLGLLYRDLSNEKVFSDFMLNQYRFQVSKMWELSPQIISKASSPEAFHCYLPKIYSQIIVPMEKEIRSLMLMFRQHSESTLFASDLRFSISKSTTDDIQNTFKFLKQDQNGGQKPDEVLEVLNQKLKKMVNKYSDLLKYFIENQTSDDFSGKINVCVALYFASYYHIKNLSCRKYLSQFINSKMEDGLLEFMKLWEYTEKERISGIKEKTLKKFTDPTTDFNSYFFNTKKVEEQCMTSPIKFQRLIELKKLFSIPWLLAHDVLFDKQDFIKKVIDSASSIKSKKPLPMQRAVSNELKSGDVSKMSIDKSNDSQEQPPSLQKTLSMPERLNGGIMVMVAKPSSEQDEDIEMSEDF